MATILTGLASILIGRHQVVAATKLFAAATSLRENIGAPLPPHEQQEFDALVERAASALEEVAFAEAWEQGSAMTWEEAADFALAVVSGAGNLGEDSPIFADDTIEA